jgi:signal transduction histidine kinase
LNWSATSPAGRPPRCALLVDLHDKVLAQQGLLAALEAQCAVVRRHSGLPVELHVGADGSGAGRPGWEARLPVAHAEALYCVAREALANVVKHARATRATVTLRQDTLVRLTIEDNGVGLSAPAPAFTYGLAGMRECVGALGGRWHVEGRPGGGTRVVAELPLPESTDR